MVCLLFKIKNICPISYLNEHKFNTETYTHMNMNTHLRSATAFSKSLNKSGKVITWGSASRV